jgi:2-phosphosulfolactate phosphatase
MKIDIIISADQIAENVIKDKTVVVVDVLRATSVIITAIGNGCTEILPVLTTEEAFEIKKNNCNCLLGGERNAVKIQGFDLSNSPLEYTAGKVEGKTLVLTTSNGTRAVKGSLGARNLLVGAIINAQAVGDRILELDNDAVIVNAGTDGWFSIDDFICSGFIIDCIAEKNNNVVLTDIAKTAHYIYKQNSSITDFIKNSSHYQKIKELNLYDDLDYCCKKNITDVVPEYNNGRIE